MSRLVLAGLALAAFACASPAPEPPTPPAPRPAAPEPPPATPEAEAPGPEPEEPTERTLEVTATAYNSLPGQTLGDPALAAWGDRLEPGMRAIAVSRDLIALGLTHRTEVRIEGLPGTWLVLDKLHRRWKRRIDVYMGHDEQAALDFGKRQVRISWTPQPGVAETK